MTELHDELRNLMTQAPAKERVKRRVADKRKARRKKRAEPSAGPEIAAPTVFQRDNRTDDEKLADLYRELRYWPLDYVMFNWQWATEEAIKLVTLPEQYQDRFKVKHGPDLWQCEELDWLGEQIRERNFDGSTPCPPIRSSIVSGHEIGKALADDESIPTPSGFARVGDVRPGDRVFGEGGSAVRVRAVRHYESAPLYRVSFADGTAVVVSGGHLWKVRGRRERRHGLHTWRVLSTVALLEEGVKRPNGESETRQWEVPACGPVHYDPRELPVDPYTYGVWLGDGCKANGRVTNYDVEVWDNVAYPHSDDGCTRTLYGLARDLKDAGLFGCTTYSAHVDPRYRRSTERLAVLQGLMDTDGWVEGSGSAAFSSASPLLAQDVAEMARSLGLRVSEPRFKPNKHAGSWYTYITWDGRVPLFRVHRKQKSLRAAGGRAQKRWIDAVEFVGYGPATCFDVEGDLFLGPQFQVTHNSTYVAWLTHFILDCWPFSKGSLSAVTDEQLRTKTWGEVGKWHNLSISRHWYDYNSARGSMTLHSRADDTHRADARTSRREKSEAMQGQHAPKGVSFYIFDEASGIPNEFFEVREGSLTSGMPMVFDFGNGTRNSGQFYENCMGRSPYDIHVRSIDSRDVQMTNKPMLDAVVAARGEDSDFVRVRVRGMFPKSGSVQFMPSDLVELAQTREMDPNVGDGHPLVLGVDVARFGDDYSVIYPRRGPDARTWAPTDRDRFNGYDDKQLSQAVAEKYRYFEGLGLRPAMIFVDGGGGYGGGVVTRLRDAGFPVTEVQPGTTRHSKPREYRYMSDFMWGRIREELPSLYLPPVGFDAEDVGARLRDQLTQREYGYLPEGSTCVHLESKKDMKKRGLSSPDDTDALGLTYASDVIMLEGTTGLPGESDGTGGEDYNPHA